MGLFGLTTLLGITSTKFKSTNKSGASQGSEALDHYSNEMGYNLMRYPLDIGDYPRGHYLIIHINEQRKTQFSASSRGVIVGGLSSVQQNKQQAATLMGGSLSSVPTLATSGVQYAKTLGENADALASSAPIIKDIYKNVQGIGKALLDVTELKKQVPGIEKQADQYLDNLKSESFLRTTVRTSDSIVLYMPNTVAFDLGQAYASPSIGGSALAAGVGALSAGGSGKQEDAIANMSPFLLAQGADKLNNDLARVAFTGATGFTTNPQIEVLYQSPDLRRFNFSFELYPRSQKEAKEVQKILTALMFHQAPEIVGAAKQSDGSLAGLGGYFMVPPSEFDIQFYYNGQENPNIPRISTCVLTSMNIDYAPDGHWHSYEVGTDLTPKVGGSGMPVGVRLTLNFQETEMMTKLNYRGMMNNLNSKHSD